MKASTRNEAATPLKAQEEDEVSGAELPWSSAQVPCNKQACVSTQSRDLCSPK